MVRSRVRHVGALCGWALGVALMLTLNSAPAAGQASTTATVRGTVQDSTGGVLPGATVTLTNTATKGVQETVTDQRGQYLFAGVFPGSYDLKVEMSGFKSYERKGMPLSPNDTRGIDVRLEVGAQTQTVTVTGQQEVISDRDRRARRRAERQADRQPLGHRPERARTDAHPAGRRHRVQPGRVDRLRVRRQRDPELHRERDPVVGELDFAGRLVPHRRRQQQRPDGQPEQLDGSGSEGAELELRRRVRRGRHQRERRDQGGQLAVPRRGSTTTFATTGLPPTIARTASPARRSPRARTSIRAATSAARSCSATATRRTATGCSSSAASKCSGSRSIRGRGSIARSRRRCATAISASCSPTAART